MLPYNQKKESILKFSTDGLTEKDAKSYWADEVSARRSGLMLDFPKGGTFAASATATSLGAARLLGLNVEPYVAVRSKRSIARDLADDFCLLYVGRGAAVISAQNEENDVVLRPGQCVLMDDAAGYVLRFTSRTKARALKLPRAWLSAKTPFPEDIALRDLVKCSGWGRALASVMDTLAPEHAHQLALPPEDIADQIGALLALAAGQERPELKTSQRATLGRLRRAMRDCLHDPTLTPARFAEQHGVSKRTLHALFAAAGSSFSKELISMRLDDAKSILADQRFSGKSIAEISALAGFAHPSHFARRFLEAFGLSPSAYRNLQQI